MMKYWVWIQRLKHFILYCFIFNSFLPFGKLTLHVIRSTSSWDRHSSPLIYITIHSYVCKYNKICTTTTPHNNVICCNYQTLYYNISLLWGALILYNEEHQTYLKYKLSSIIIDNVAPNHHIIDFILLALEKKMIPS